mmetsp:Transcript_19916/g.17021  ORF Transcript_19916/g.17021 Transcript_19916/m.17021 type:complete len:122 (+) Transcript_19916:109-474(+)
MQVRNVLNGYFYGAVLQPYMQKDYQKPLFLTFGSDNFDSMGIPSSGNMSPYDILLKMSRDYFPPEKEEAKENKAYYDPSKYPETKIDSTKLEKDHEMERLHKIDKNESPSSTSNERNLRSE